MKLANLAVFNQVRGGPDPSNGATAWDGREQALIPDSEKRTSVQAKEYGGKTGTWEVHKNTIGWEIQDSHMLNGKQMSDRASALLRSAPPVKEQLDMFQPPYTEILYFGKSDEDLFTLDI